MVGSVFFSLAVDGFRPMNMAIGNLRSQRRHRAKRYFLSGLKMAPAPMGGFMGLKDWFINVSESLKASHGDLVRGLFERTG